MYTSYINIHIIVYVYMYTEWVREWHWPGEDLHGNRAVKSHLIIASWVFVLAGQFRNVSPPAFPPPSHANSLQMPSAHRPQQCCPTRSAGPHPDLHTPTQIQSRWRTSTLMACKHNRSDFAFIPTGSLNLVFIHFHILITSQLQFIRRLFKLKVKIKICLRHLCQVEDLKNPSHYTIVCLTRESLEIIWFKCNLFIYCGCFTDFRDNKLNFTHRHWKKKYHSKNIKEYEFVLTAH